MAGLVGWRADVARREARDVAAVLGVRACPVCRAEVSVERRDRAGSVRWRRDGGWTCHACDAGGDALALVLAVAVGRHRSASGSDWAEAERLAVSAGLATAGEVAATGNRMGARSEVRDPHRPISVREQAREELARRIAAVAVSCCGQSVKWWLRNGARDEAARPERIAQVTRIEWEIIARGGDELVTLGSLVSPSTRAAWEAALEAAGDRTGLRVYATRAEWRRTMASIVARGDA